MCARAHLRESTEHRHLPINPLVSFRSPGGDLLVSVTVFKAPQTSGWLRSGNSRSGDVEEHSPTSWGGKELIQRLRRQRHFLIKKSNTAASSAKPPLVNSRDVCVCVCVCACVSVLCVFQCHTADRNRVIISFFFFGVSK